MTLRSIRLAVPAMMLSLALAGCVTLPTSSGKLEQEAADNARMLFLVSEALKANMSVVLVADLTPHKSLGDAEGMKQWTSRVIWTHETRPEVAFSRQFQNNALQRDPKTTYLFKAFEVHILPPGKYLLTGGDDYKFDASLGQLGARAGKPGSGQGAGGTAYLSPETYREYYVEQAWKDATTHTQTGTQRVCTTVHRASGNCVAWADQQYTETSQGSAAGYYNQTDSRDIPALKVSARVPPAQALASFTLQGGQLVLAQRTHLKTPSYRLRQSACRKVEAEKVECPLEDFTVYTLPAPMDFTRDYLSRPSVGATDAQRQLLSRMVPMQITPLGRQGRADPVWGTPISLPKGQ